MIDQMIEWVKEYITATFWMEEPRISRFKGLRDNWQTDTLTDTTSLRDARTHLNHKFLSEMHHKKSFMVCGSY